MREILNIINAIATPHFMEIYELLQNISPTNAAEYKDIFRQWFLYSELRIIDNNAQQSYDSSQRRILNQSIFKPGGIYNTNRLSLL